MIREAQCASNRGRNSECLGHRDDGHGMSEIVERKDTDRHANCVRILVVDDAAPIRTGLRRMLEAHSNWEICGEAVNGAEAIQKHRLLQPDVMIIDLSMPVMNGLDASLEILKHSENVLILLYTAHLTHQLVEFAHNAGIRGRVSKDTMPLIVDAVEALLRGEEFSGPVS